MRLRWGAWRDVVGDPLPPPLLLVVVEFNSAIYHLRQFSWSCSRDKSVANRIIRSPSERAQEGWLVPATLRGQGPKFNATDLAPC